MSCLYQNKDIPSEILDGIFSKEDLSDSEHSNKKDLKSEDTQGLNKDNVKLQYTDLKHKSQDCSTSLNLNI